MLKNYHGRVLIVDDDPQTCRFWQVALQDQGFRVDYCHDLAAMEQKIQQAFADAVLLDLDLGKDKGLDGLPLVLGQSPFSKVFILTAHGSMDTAIDALRNGATDYITKDTAPEGIAEKIKASLSKPDPQPKAESLDLNEIGLIGRGKTYTQLCGMIEKVKDVDSTILILGESGTGKEVVARAIHERSHRREHHFAAINCAAIPESLLESELFGHRKGAFTDAKADRKGIFELCSEGTLLLDEIGDMPLALQAKLLRVLQEKQVMPVGASQGIAINTRVLAATHRDLIEEIQSGRFREDLYFRLSVVPIKIPPLRHRKDDIAVLVQHFLKDLNKRFRKNVAPPNADVMHRMMAYDWPGNIRELRNAIERAVVLSSDNQFELDHLFQHLVEHKERGAKGRHAKDNGGIDAEIFRLPLTEAKQKFEKIYVEQLLEETRGNIAELARRCGRYRADIYRLFEKYGIDHTQYR